MMQRFFQLGPRIHCADSVINLTDPVEERRTVVLKPPVLPQPLDLLAPCYPTWRANARQGDWWCYLGCTL